MATIDTQPESVDIVCLAGDTLTLEVTADASLTDGMTWSAQLRATTDAVAVDDTWTITEPQTSGGPGYLTLTEAQTRALAGGGVFVREMREGRAVTVQRYTGVWDLQLAPPGGGDPVTTIVSGSLTINLDVTR